MSESTTPLLVEVIEAAIDGVLAGVRGSLPGRIESYDKTTRRATVQPLVMDGHVDGDGERQTTVIPVLTDVPVLRLGSGTERFLFPVRAGDRCIVVFSSSSIARLKSLDDVVDPEDDRHHHEADGIAITGFFLQGPGSDPPGTLLEIDDADVLHLGASPAPHPALLSDPFLSQLTTLVTAIAAAFTALPAGAGAAGGTAVTNALATFNAAVASYTSTKVKVI